MLFKFGLVNFGVVIVKRFTETHQPHALVFTDYNCPHDFVLLSNYFTLADKKHSTKNSLSIASLFSNLYNSAIRIRAS